MTGTNMYNCTHQALEEVMDFYHKAVLSEWDLNWNTRICLLIR